MNKHEQNIKVLLKYKANINLVDKRNQTALMKGNHILIILSLLTILYWYFRSKKRDPIVTTEYNTNTHFPTIYNNTMNIHIWLNKFEEYLDANKIQSEKTNRKQ